MRDRMSELKKASGELAVPEIKATVQANVDLEKGAGNDESGMKAYFDEISNLRGVINSIKKMVQDVEETHGKALTSVSEEQGQDHAKAVDALMDQINAQSSILQKKLKSLDQANKKFEEKNSGSSDSRIRVSQHAVLVRKFTDVMTEYNAMQNKYKGKYKQRLQKQYLIVKPDATPAEIETVVNGEGGASIFAQQIMPGAQYMEARQALEDIQERHQDIMKIEKSILELQQLFVDMSVLVAQQGDILNQIDTNVVKAVEYTNSGVEEMKKAVVLQKKTRKRACMVIFCLIVLAIVVALSISLKK